MRNIVKVIIKNEANRIFEKYQTKCNKNNKLLLLEDNNCLNIKGDNHTH